MTKRPSTHPHRCEPLLTGWIVGATGDDEQDKDQMTRKRERGNDDRTRGTRTRMAQWDERDKDEDGTTTTG